MSSPLRRLLPTLLLLLSPAFGAVAAAAPTSDPMIDSAQLCMQHFAHAEAENGIPKQLLSAIAVTESGRWSDGAKATVPWPWTINSGGQGYYFETMHEAIVFAQRLRQKGVDSMDVGCMQINLHHHPEAFASLLDAFDPEKNVAYGAKFLRGQFDDLKSWPEAIAAYHSRTAEFGHPYYASVRANWQRVLHGGDIAVADAGTAPTGSRSMVRGVEVTRGTAASGTAPRRANSTFQIAVSDEDGTHAIDEMRRGRRVATRMPANMPARDAGPRVIRVGEGSSRAIASSGDARAPEVLIVRPAIDKTSQVKALAGATKASGKGSVSLAMNEPREIGADRFVVTPASTSVRGVKVTGAESKPAARRSGPNFIFD